MKSEYIYSLRIDFTGACAQQIAEKGISKSIQKLLESPLTAEKPDFILSENDFFEQKKLTKQLSEEQKKERAKIDRKRFGALQAWWLTRIYTTENPLQEKMVFFWHNHFVSSYQKVKSTTLLFYQNQLFRQYAFGNFKELTRQILYDNAMLEYLDNQQNKAGRPNENLSRELLELFTLGIGNYSENDIKEGARALAGLSEYTDRGHYNPKKEDNDTKVYLNKKGNLKADDLIEAIFDHPLAANRITEKLLKYFLTDTPDKKLVENYAAYLRKNNFEITPFIKKLFSDKNFLDYNGSKIKDPLTFILQTFREVNFEKAPPKPTLIFLKNQGMALMNPPNVKGWDGGKAWLDSGKLIARNSAINALFNKKFVPDKSLMKQEMNEEEDSPTQDTTTLILSIKWSTNDTTNSDVINEFTERLLFMADKEIQDDMENILKYDFDPKAEGAVEGVTQLVRFIMKTPNYQIL